jgi:hypothetical protein
MNIWYELKGRYGILANLFFPVCSLQIIDAQQHDAKIKA